jgi:hypothetical protein
MSTTPLSLRIDVELKQEIDKMARVQNRSLTEITQDALRLLLAQTCQSCNAVRERLSPGLTPAFSRWVEVHRREGVYLILKQNGITRAYKGILWNCDDRTVTLSPIARNGLPDGIFLREQVLDWRSGDHGPDTQPFERANPNIPVESWGLGKA